MKLHHRVAYWLLRRDAKPARFETLQVRYADGQQGQEAVLKFESIADALIGLGEEQVLSLMNRSFLHKQLSTARRMQHDDKYSAIAVGSKIHQEFQAAAGDEWFKKVLYLLGKKQEGYYWNRRIVTVPNNKFGRAVIWVLKRLLRNRDWRLRGRAPKVRGARKQHPGGLPLRAARKIAVYARRRPPLN